MVNLLGRDRAAPVVADLAPARRADLQRRLRAVAALARIGWPERIAPYDAALAGELEELDVAPTRVAAEALLDALEGARSGILARRGAGLPPASAEPAGARDGEVESASRSEAEALREVGLFVAHRPGRSLATGEAEIASRGWCDVRDRPPLDGWIGVLPGVDGAGGDADFWIVVWVPPADAARAQAACRACPNGAISLLEALAPALEAELVAAMQRALRASGSVASRPPGSAGRGAGRRP